MAPVVEDGVSNDPDEPARSRKALWVASGLLGVQALAAAGYGVLIVGRITHAVAGVGYGVGGMMIAWGVALGLVGRGVALARRWSRGAAVCLQLLNLPLAWGFRTSIGWLALALFLTTAVALICILSPSSTTAFTADRDVPFSRRS